MKLRKKLSVKYVECNQIILIEPIIEMYDNKRLSNVIKHNRMDLKLASRAQIKFSKSFFNFLLNFDCHTIDLTKPNFTSSILFLSQFH